MPRTLLVEQFHLTIRAPAQLPAAEDKAIQQTLRSQAFQRRLRQAVHKTMRQYRTLRKTTVRIER